MRRWIILLVNLLVVIPFTISNGKFYVGFLRYANRGNYKMDGTCCDGTFGADGKCHVTCDLMFQVSAYGLDSVNMTNKRPSRLPINDSNSFIFSEEYKDAINPITFDFKKWPGKVHLVVQVFDQDHDSISSNNTLEAVDDMDFLVNLDEPSLKFVYQNMTGNRRRKPSEIMLLFRYECGPTYYGKDCNTDCLMYPTSPVCPRTSTLKPSTHLPTEPLTPTTECTSTAAELTTSTTESTERLTTDSTTPTVPTSTPGEPTTETSTSDASSSTSVRVTSTAVSSPETSSSQQTEATEPLTQTQTSQTFPSTTDRTERTTSPETSTSFQITENSSSGTTAASPRTTETSVDFNQTTTVSPNTPNGTNIPPSNTDGTSSITKAPSSTSKSLTNAPTVTSETSPGSTTDTFTTSKNARTLITRTTSSPPLSTTASASTSSASASTSSSASKSSVSASSGKPSTPGIVSTGDVDATSTIAQTAIVSNGKPTEYSHVITDAPNNDWAIIVGCVLGVLAIMAVILFLVYRNRQRRLQKRQEIYNVSPEVMSVVEENGTTERSDVPITTSPL